MDWMNIVLSLAVIYLYFMNRVNGVNICILRQETNYSLKTLNGEIHDLRIKLNELEEKLEDIGINTHQE